jgi:hypothetical protein
LDEADVEVQLTIYALPKAFLLPALCGGFHVSVAWGSSEISFESEGIALHDKGAYNCFYYLGSRSLGWARREEVEALAQLWLNEPDLLSEYDSEDNNCQHFAAMFVRRNLA